MEVIAGSVSLEHGGLASSWEDVGGLWGKQVQMRGEWRGKLLEKHGETAQLLPGLI